NASRSAGARARGALGAVLAHVRARFRRYAIGLVALWLALALLVPVIVRHVLTGSVAKELGREVAVDSVRFNPLTLTLYLYDLRVADRDPKQPFVEVGRIAANLSFTSL